MTTHHNNGDEIISDFTMDSIKYTSTNKIIVIKSYVDRKKVYKIKLARYGKIGSFLVVLLFLISKMNVDGATKLASVRRLADMPINPENGASKFDKPSMLVSNPN